MSNREGVTTELPAVGASGATGIRPDGFLAKLVEGNRSSAGVDQAVHDANPPARRNESSSQ